MACIFPLLKAPDSYDPSTLDYDEMERRGLPGKAEWIEVFRASLPQYFKMICADASLPEAEREQVASQFVTDFNAALDALVTDCTRQVPVLEEQLPRETRLTCVRLCRIREAALRRLGVFDPFAETKATENDRAVGLLAQVLADIDAMPPGEARFEALLRGVFAGNVFDLGAASTAEKFNEGRGSGAMFHSARASLAARPWAVDHCEEAVSALASGRHRKAMLFVDNAGADVVLGMLPLARELLRSGAEVLLCCNSLPSVNDITAPEMEQLLPRVADADAVLASAISSDRLRVVADGNDLPVIDLRRVSQELVDECAGVDLVVLEGMGRAIETNLHVALTVDVLCVGMIKHREVAQSLGGRLFDCVCRFQAAAP